MTTDETARITAYIAAAYPNVAVTPSMCQIWHECFEDVGFDLVNAALKRVMLTSKFPPSIAEVRTACVDLAIPAAMDASEAWGKVLHAIHWYGYPDEAGALASLPPDVATIAQRMGWQEICTTGEVGVTRGQFVKLYNAHIERKRSDMALPANLRPLPVERRELALAGEGGAG